MSYDGGLNFGLVGDYDVMADLDELAGDVTASLEELRLAAGVGPAVPPALSPNGVRRLERAQTGA
jgi:hypothetical protein